MKIRYDQDADAMYIKLRNDDIDHTKEAEGDEDIIIDYNKAGQVVGVEVLFVKERNPSLLKEVQFENLVPA